MSAGSDVRPPRFLREVVTLEWQGEPMASDVTGLDPARPWEPLWLVLWRRDAREWVRLKGIFEGSETP